MVKSHTIMILLVFLMTVSQAQYCLLPNCQSCPNSPYVCNSCPLGVQCCQSSCTNCLNQTQCAACSPAYTLNSVSSVCQLTQSCSQSACNECFGNNCQTCKATYVINPYTYECVQCPSNCNQCSLNGTCSACLPMYYINGGLCSPCSANCANCTTINACTTCLPGYTVGTNGLCQACIANCQYCNSTATC